MQLPDVQKHSPEVFCEKGVLKIFSNFTGKHLCWSLFLIKLPAFSLQVFYTYFQKHLQTTASGGQKQSSRGVLQKRCSQKFHKIHRKTLMPESLFLKKVTGLRPATLLKMRLWHRCFPVTFVKFLTTPFSQNTSGGCFWEVLYKKVVLKNFAIFT